MVSNNKDKEPLKENIQDPELKKEDAREDEEVEEAPQQTSHRRKYWRDIKSIQHQEECTNRHQERFHERRSLRLKSGEITPRVGTHRRTDSLTVEHNSEMIRNLIYRIDELQELIEKLVKNPSPPSPKE
ncbi:hypothetical protein QYE76_039775 [Lolium multiflorum]|uniref:Uncharacterized protein n=1 Tax=Lolium multiflorum TaxID=4521 RepID=A0AAD8TBP9_LOLMU|nr:hypothetical protein QYE76_039775 [Lolium multiflorum]